jgi:hypothetical protein
LISNHLHPITPSSCESQVNTANIFFETIRGLVCLNCVNAMVAVKPFTK